MDNNIKSIIPNIKKYVNRRLLNTKIENSSWYDTINGREYSFMKVNRLLVEINGQIYEGRWELLPNDKIVINMDGTALAYNILFFKEHWIILLHPLHEHEPLILSDSVSTNLISLIEELNTNLVGEKIDYISLDGKRMLSNDMFTQGYIALHSKLKNEYTLHDGIYKHSNISYNRIEIANGFVNEVFYLRSYNTKYGEVWFKQKQKYIDKGDVLDNISKDILQSLKDRVIRIEDIDYHLNEEGRVIKVADINLRRVFIMIAIFIIFIILHFATKHLFG